MLSKFKFILWPSAILMTIASCLWQPWERADFLLWPYSAEGRIEEMASILQRIKAPARWCQPSEHSSNLVRDGGSMQSEFNACVVEIKPAGDFIETEKNEYLQRYYRARRGSYVCEVNLSTVWNDRRIVGSDCYFGLFREQDDTGVGMTDDEFGRMPDVQ